jgi:D-alanyl-D-alanine carboxypeptidase
MKRKNVNSYNSYTAADNPFQLPGKTLEAHGHLQCHPALEWTGGGLASTSRDLARWGSLLFTGRAMPGEYLPLLLETVPINNAADSSRYGLGVAVNASEHFGLVYGHAGWIPGYVSSLRYYHDVGVAVAFQINSDVGITDKPNILNQIETRLINTLLGHGINRLK